MVSSKPKIMRYESDRHVGGQTACAVVGRLAGWPFIHLGGLGGASRVPKSSTQGTSPKVGEGYEE